MMELTQQAQELIEQIVQLLQQLSTTQYSQPLAVLHEHTIGQHTRHVIEFFAALEQGYEQGTVQFDNRSRDKVFECEKDVAQAALKTFAAAFDKQDKPMQLLLHSGCRINTSYARELAFVLDHTVHHMALLRIGADQFEKVRLPEDFGVAVSTQQYRSSCAP